jgi:hypothetical protein
MMGLGRGIGGATITPGASGKIMVTLAGYLMHTTGGECQALLFYGTGAAPVNGAVTSGNLVGNGVQASCPAANSKSPFTLNALITGLTPGTTYWIDAGVASVLGTATASMRSVAVSAYEIP